MTTINQQNSLRYLGVALIVLGMLIPLMFVDSVVQDRQHYQSTVFSDVASGWGGEQVLTGPFLVVPETHRYQVQNDKGDVKWRSGRRYRIHLPQSLQVDMDVTHQFRQRAIYAVPVYAVEARVTGSVKVSAAPAPTSSAGPREVIVHLEQAQLIYSIADTQGITELSDLAFNNATLPFAAGTTQPWLTSGVHVPLSGLTADTEHAFEFTLAFKGTRNLGFSLLSSSSKANMQATWPHPSFSGSVLPDDYSITADGFVAAWTQHKFATGLPTSWLSGDDDVQVQQSIAHVALFEPVTNYTIVNRGIKYGILFVGLTFLTFVCFELMTQLRFHFIQYAVVGGALVLFYQTLLALSEHMSFLWAYVAATLLLSGLVTWYVWRMTTQKKITAWVGGVVLSLYLCMYVLLQLEAHALLVGTLLLICALIALMYATRGLTETRTQTANQLDESSGADGVG